MLHDQPDNTGKLVAHADDFTAVGTFADLISYETHCEISCQSLDITCKLLNLGLSSQKSYHEKKKKIISDIKLGQLSPKMSTLHCVKSLDIRSYSGPYFPAFALNTDTFYALLIIKLEIGWLKQDL